jgi:soluble lytic murein transglycosylase-like protein
MLNKVVLVICLVLVVSPNVRAQRQRDSSMLKRVQSLEPYILDSAKRYRLDPRLLRVLCFLESRFRLDAISPKGARGPMQFMPETAVRYGLTNPHDPRAAIDAAARYLRDLLRRFDGRLDLALAAYNAGEGTVEAFRNGRALRLANGKMVNAGQLKTGGIPPYRETQNYVRSAIRLLTHDGLVVARATPATITNRNVTSVRDFTIDVSATLSASFSSEEVTPFFIDIP